MACNLELSSERAGLQKHLVARFNEDGKPLTRRALDVLVGHLLPLSSEDRATCLQRIFDALAVGAHL